MWNTPILFDSACASVTVVLRPSTGAKYPIDSEDTDKRFLKYFKNFVSQEKKKVLSK